MHNRSIRWLATTAAIAAGLLSPSAIGASAASAQSTPPPTLSGETFTAGSGGGIACGLAGGPFSFTVSGTATGPYPGTFTETGSGTVTGLGGTLGSFTATFRIDSAVGFPEVTGTKTLTSQRDLPCYVDTSNFLVTANTDYQATIHTSQGNYADQGTAPTVILETNGTVNNFKETFASSQTQTTLIEPTSVDQCKHGGYENYPQFKNQHECVAYAETH